jgi:hypothetical protein
MPPACSGVASAEAACTAAAMRGSGTADALPMFHKRSASGGVARGSISAWRCHTYVGRSSSSSAHAPADILTDVRASASSLYGAAPRAQQHPSRGVHMRDLCSTQAVRPSACALGTERALSAVGEGVHSVNRACDRMHNGKECTQCEPSYVTAWRRIPMASRSGGGGASRHALLSSARCAGWCAWPHARPRRCVDVGRARTGHSTHSALECRRRAVAARAWPRRRPSAAPRP